MMGRETKAETVKERGKREEGFEISRLLRDLEFLGNLTSERYNLIVEVSDQLL